MLRPVMILLAALLLTAPVRADAVETAFEQAIALFEAARPDLSGDTFGVDIAAYRDALTLRRFSSGHWGGETLLDVAAQAGNGGSCGRYAAFVRIPPRDGRVGLVICPQFVSEGSDGLRRLTVLHEMVHVVAGPDECRAMAFAARIEHLATGAFTPVERYWQANDCAGSAFSLP